MSPPSGFVPIPFRKVGKLLIAIGSTGIGLMLASRFMGGLAAPVWGWPMGFLLIAAGGYLIVFAPAEGEER